MPTITQRTCARCGWAYDEEAFFNDAGGRRDASIPAYAKIVRRRTVCAGCEQTESDRRKNQRRSLVKAANAITSHARRAGMERAEFALHYGWDVQRMAYDLDHAHDNTCAYCWQPYAEMEGGLAAVTLDILDPTAEPYYRTNTKWACRTCNAQKQRMRPDLWARRCGAWAQWRENQDREPPAPRLFTLDPIGGNA